MIITQSQVLQAPSILDRDAKLIHYISALVGGCNR